MYAKIQKDSKTATHNKPTRNKSYLFLSIKNNKIRLKISNWKSFQSYKIYN